jgi:hypothetical protein
MGFGDFGIMYLRYSRDRPIPKKEKLKNHLPGGRMVLSQPKTWSYNDWRKFFTLAALWNFTGLFSLLFSRLNMQIFYGINTNDFHTIMLNQLIWAFVIIFGIGYCMIAYRPEKNVGIVIMGILGKITVAIFWFPLFLSGKAALIAALAAFGDSVFAIYFFIYLTCNKNFQH